MAQEPPKSVVLSPLKLVIAQFDVLTRFLLRVMSSFLPSSSRSKWWRSAFSHHAFQLLHRIPHSSLADITSISSTCIPLQHHIISSLCGPLAGGRVLPRPTVYTRPLLSSRGRRCELTTPGGDFTYIPGGGSLPLPHSVTGFAIWHDILWTLLDY